MAIVEELVAVLGYKVEGKEELQKFKSSLDDTAKAAEASAARSELVGKALAAGIITAASAVVLMNKGFSANEEKITSWANTSNTSVAKVTSGWISVQAAAYAAGVPMEDAEAAMDKLLASGMDFGTALSSIPGLLQAVRVTGKGTAEDIANAWTKLGPVFGYTKDQIKEFNDQLLAGGNAGPFEAKDVAKHGPATVGAAGDLLPNTPQGLRIYEALMNTLTARLGSSDQAANRFENLAGKLNVDQKVREKLKGKGIDIDALKGKQELWTALAEWAARDQAGVDEIFHDQQANQAVKALGQSAQPQFKDQSFPSFYERGGAQGGETAQALGNKLNSSAQAWQNLASAASRASDAIGLLASTPVMHGVNALATTLATVTRPIEAINDYLYGDGASRPAAPMAPGNFGQSKPAPAFGSAGAFGLNQPATPGFYGAAPVVDPTKAGIDGVKGDMQVTNTTTNNTSVSAPITVNVQQAAQAPGAVGGAIAGAVNGAVNGTSTGAAPGRMQPGPSQP